MDLESFDPTKIPFQYEVMHDFLHDYSCSARLNEVLLSGAVGSAKSTLMAAIAIMYCMKFPGARVMIGRESLADLKLTLFSEIQEMIPNKLVEGRDYFVREGNASVSFTNGSRIFSKSWGDGKILKFRSLTIDAVFLEELTENKDDEFYKEILKRLGRRPGYPPLLMSATNPDEPSHWVYQRFIRKEAATRHTYYSKTRDNIFLPPEYVQGLESEMSKRQALRDLEGFWIRMATKNIYHSYGKANATDEGYALRYDLPIIITHDFNVGKGKPMSAAVAQWCPETDHVHVFDESVVEGFRTMDILEDLSARPWFGKCETVICGDATGSRNTSNSRHSDWEIVNDFYSNKNLSRGFRFCVPDANPAIRTRHNIVNGKLENARGESKMTCYRRAVKCKEGLELTALKKGSDTVEDDTKDYQHITTAIGYMCCEKDNILAGQSSRSLDL